MSSTTKARPQKQPKTQLSLFGDLKPEDSLPIFRFIKPGDAILAEFLKRRTGIRTRIDNDAHVIDVDVVECSDETTTGVHPIFLSTHLRKIFDQVQLNRGDRFVLKLSDINDDSGFKRFAFRLVQEEKAPADDDVSF